MAYLPPLPPHLNEDAFWEDNNNPFRDLHQPMPRPPFVPDDDDWEAVPVAFGRSREADNMRFGEIPASLLQGTWTRQQCIDHVAIIEEVMGDEKYPKERVERQAQQQVLIQHTKAMQNHRHYAGLCHRLLRDEFMSLTTTTILKTVTAEKTIPKAFMTLSALAQAATPRALKRKRLDDDAQTLPLAAFEPELVDFVQKELATARSRLTNLENQPHPAHSQARASAAVVEEVECACCFGDVSSTQTAHCDGAIPHAFCWDCTKRNVETEIEYRRSKPKCMDQSRCEALFADHQLRLALDEKTMSHLLRLRQQDDLKASGIEGLTECPFCDYIEPCHPIDIDREFRCKNEACLRVSCRLCQKDTHLPLTCAQAEKDRKLDARHTLEEAMTEALVRTCNKCKTNFVKTEGCNSMHCPTCSNHQCYVCGKNIKGYDHFGARGATCASHDNEGVEARHRKDVKNAEEIAKLKIRVERPDISEDELVIKVSDPFQQAEARAARPERVPGHPFIPLYPGAHHHHHHHHAGPHAGLVNYNGLHGVHQIPVYHHDQTVNEIHHGAAHIRRNAQAQVEQMHWNAQAQTREAQRVQHHHEVHRAQQAYGAQRMQMELERLRQDAHRLQETQNQNMRQQLMARHRQRHEDATEERGRRAEGHVRNVERDLFKRQAEARRRDAAAREREATARQKDAEARQRRADLRQQLVDLPSRATNDRDSGQDNTRSDIFEDYQRLVRSLDSDSDLDDEFLMAIDESHESTARRAADGAMPSTLHEPGTPSRVDHFRDRLRMQQRESQGHDQAWMTRIRPFRGKGAATMTPGEEQYSMQHSTASTVNTSSSYHIDDDHQEQPEARRKPSETGSYADKEARIHRFRTFAQRRYYDEATLSLTTGGIPVKQKPDAPGQANNAIRVEDGGGGRSGRVMDPMKDAESDDDVTILPGPPEHLWEVKTQSYMDLTGDTCDERSSWRNN